MPSHGTPYPCAPLFPYFHIGHFITRAGLIGRCQMYDVIITIDVNDLMTSFNVIVTHLKYYVTSLVPRLPITSSSLGCY